MGELEATQFSTTTKLNGAVNVVVGANTFSGSADLLVDDNKQTFGATTFQYDLQLNLDTSFTGKDLLRATLRSGNFDGGSNSFWWRRSHFVIAGSGLSRGRWTECCGD